MKYVLVVDDEPHLTYMLAHKLRGEGVEVHQAPNGREGLAAAAQRTPSLVITDYQMPEMSGLEMAQNLRAQQPTATIPIIMITGRTHRVPPLELAKTNIQHLMGKPFSMTELLDRVRELLDLGDPSADADPPPPHFQSNAA